MNAEGFRPLAEEGKKRREGAAGAPLSYQETALQTLGDSGLHVVHVKKTTKKKALRTQRARFCNKTAEQTRAGGRAGDRKQPFGRREGRGGVGSGGRGSLFLGGATECDANASVPADP